MPHRRLRLHHRQHVRDRDSVGDGRARSATASLSTAARARLRRTWTTDASGPTVLCCAPPAKPRPSVFSRRTLPSLCFACGPICFAAPPHSQTQRSVPGDIPYPRRAVATRLVLFSRCTLQTSTYALFCLPLLVKRAHSSWLCCVFVFFFLGFALFRSCCSWARHLQFQSLSYVVLSRTLPVSLSLSHTHTPPPLYHHHHHHQ
jgi:hypothetical protein